MRVATMRAIGIAVRPLSLSVLLTLVLAPDLPAQDATGWVGKRVILQFNSVLRVGKDVVDNQKLEASGRGGLRETSRIYRVEHVNGPWIWLQAEKASAAGWIPAAEVILYDQAIEYFTKSDPGQSGGSLGLYQSRSDMGGQEGI